MADHESEDDFLYMPGAATKVGGTSTEVSSLGMTAAQEQARRTPEQEKQLIEAARDPLKWSGDFKRHSERPKASRNVPNPSPLDMTSYATSSPSSVKSDDMRTTFVIHGDTSAIDGKRIADVNVRFIVCFAPYHVIYFSKYCEIPVIIRAHV